MFHSPLLRSATIVSDEGFRVVLRTRYQLEYRDEAGLQVSLNYDAGRADVDLLTLSLEATRDDRLVALSSPEQDAVLKRIAAAMAWKGYVVHLVASK